MAFLRRRWTPEAAEEWTKEDWLAAILASLSYIFLAVGLALSLLLMWKGYLLFLLGIFFALAMYYVVDPKLKVMSSEYEAKQRKYLSEVEKAQRWEE